MTILGTTLALAMAFATWTPSLQADQLKGAERIYSSRTVSDSATPDKAMSCPKCKTELVSSTEIQKGHIAVEKVVATHVCPGCGIERNVVGAGKAKTEVVTHVCKVGGEAAGNCCATN